MPDFDKYEKDLAKIADELNKSIDDNKIAGIFSNEIVKYIDKNFNTQKGILVLDVQAIKALKKFTNTINKSVTSNANYEKSILNFLTVLNKSNHLRLDFFNEVNTPLSKAEVSAGQQIVIDELLNQYMEQGINNDIINPAKRQVQAAVLGGFDKNKTVEEITNANIARVEKFNKANTEAADDGYQSVINKKLYEKYADKITHIRVTNTLIKTSSPQCRLVVNDFNREFKLSDWPEIEKLARGNGLIKGTTLANLAVNKLHYNCRHGFTPIIKVT